MELVNKVADWIQSQGYPLEMRVAAIFRKAGFRTWQSEYYQDPESQVAREIDVVAHAQDEIGGCLVRFSLCIECKVSREKPWVLLTSQDLRLADPARVAQRVASSLGSRLLLEVAHKKKFQNLKLLQLPMRPAFGVTQAFTSGNDVAYGAFMSAAKAALAAASEGDETHRYQGPFLVIIIPAVVIDGRLFECFLDPEGEPVVEEVTSGTLVWRNPVTREPHTIIKVATASAVDELARHAAEAARLILRSEEEVRKLLESQKLKPRLSRLRLGRKQKEPNPAAADGREPPLRSDSRR